MKRPLLLLLVLAGCQHSEPDTPMNTPEDPYLWLEDVRGERALDWAKAENEKTFAVLKQDPRYEEIRGGIEDILEAKDRIPHGAIRKGMVYNFWRDGKNIRGLWRRIPLKDYLAKGEDWEVVLDIDALAKEEGENWIYAGVDTLAPDFTRGILSLSRDGKDANVKREFDLETKSFIEEGFILPEAKSDTDWVDRDMLLVGTDFGEGSMTESGYPRTIRAWKRGTPLAEARILYEGKPDDVRAWSWAHHGPEGSTLLLGRSITFYTTELCLLAEDLDSTLKLPLPEDIEAGGIFGNRQLILQLRSDWTVGGVTHRQGSVLTMDLQPFKQALADGAEAPEPELRSLYAPDTRSSVRGIRITREEIVIELLTDVRSRALRFRLEDGAWRERVFELPGSQGVGSLMSVSAYEDDCFVGYEDLLTPDSLYHFNFKTDALTPVRSVPARFDAEGMRVEQRFATSKDGTKIPYFLVLPKGFEEGEARPTYLYAYGGFEIPQMPYYRSVTGKYWAERGGVFAIANIRGGGEYGPAWHQAALKENRQRAFDDFHAVAEDLVSTGVTTKEQLGIHGGSNGGLLMGVMLTQRPDLYKAIICEVPLLDMMRYHKLLAGASWVAEYGDPDIAEEREVLMQYSPYHNVHMDRRYPRTFFTTSTADDRVHPGHARKMAARMREQGHELFYYENIEGGHGGVSNNKQRAESLGMKFVYLLRELGLK